MNNLEQELKCTLFLRSNKGIALTPEGRQLYEHVALAFEQLSIGEEEIRQNGELEHGLVSIGASENALRLILLESWSCSVNNILMCACAFSTILLPRLYRH